MPFKCIEKRRAWKKAYYEANKKETLAKKKAYYEANKEEKIAKAKAYRKANKKETLAKAKAYYEANKEEILAQKKAYRKANKKKIAATRKAYQQANTEKFALRSAKRKALKLKQIPVHLRDCPHEKKRLVEIYKLRKILSEATGVQHHVDHMWPIADGGPHWSGNLQVIPAEENMRKNASVCEDTKATIIKSLYTFESERSI
jgi:hypothetical protein